MVTITASAFEKIADKTTLRIRSAMRRYHIPGVAVGLIAEGHTWTGQFGVTNLENPLPVNDQTLFQIGSITKTITALIAMRLVESGHLALDTPVRRYLPDLLLSDEETAARVTVRHLFQHTAGWLGDYFDDTGPGDDALERVVERMARLPQETPLGSVWSYNNAAFYLAARVLEVVSGKTYESLAHELVLAPLGMNHAFFFAHEAITFRTAAGHSAIFEPGKTPDVLRPWGLGRCANAVGGLNVHIQDMLRYARFQMGTIETASSIKNNQHLLSPQGLAVLHTPSVPAANGEFTGLSWFVREANGYRTGIRLIRHGGATNGQMATLVIAPSEQVALCILTNSDRGSELYAPLTRWLLNELLAIPNTLPKPRRTAANKLAEAAGRYRAAADELILSVEEGTLWLEQKNRGGFPTPDSPPSPNPPRVRLAYYAPDRVMVIDEPGKNNFGEFLRRPDGTIQFFRIGSRAHLRENATTTA
jgi:CubicO group peptidase (beta-lactamase class C family)